MGNIDDALEAIKTCFERVDPSPEDPPAGVWVYPNDYDEIDWETFPCVIVSQVVNQPMTWQVEARDLDNHAWLIEATVLLALGPVTRDPELAAFEQMHEPWIKAVGLQLRSNRTLFGSVVSTGRGLALFTYQIGQVNFYTRTFWGIRFEIPVNQSVSY